MGNLQDRLASATKLREAEKLGEARQLLLELHAEFPNDPQVNYHCAWIHDLLGFEREAIPFYEKAIQAGLTGDDLKSALLGLGSTYRCTGEYPKSIDTLQRALTMFPNSHEFKVFLGMAYYNIGEYSKAMELLLNSLADTSAMKAYAAISAPSAFILINSTGHGNGSATNCPPARRL